MTASSQPAMWNHLASRRAEFASRVAVAASRAQLTFDEVFAAAEKFAEALSRHGVGRGETVGIALPNGIGFMPALVALYRAGATVALVSPRYAAAEMTAIVRGGGVTSVLATHSHAEKLASLLEGSIALETDAAWPGEALRLVRISAPTRVADESVAPPALVKFTSGSTGEPKGIALSVDNVVAEATNIVETLVLTADDRILAQVPLCHSYGFDLGILAALFSGASLRLNDYLVPRRMIDDWARDEISVCLGTPDQYRRCLEAAERVTTPPPTMRYLLSCTALLSPETVAAFHERFAMPICQHYGSSETGAATNHVPSEVMRRPASVGLPMKNVDVRIVDSQGRDMGPNEEGEIVIRSAAVAQGYIMGAPAGASPFRGDGFRTGDLGIRDADGFVHVHGRMDGLINVQGLKVSPLEVSRVLENHPAVREAAVLGMRDSAGNEEVVAAVALRDAASAGDLIKHCYTQLADYKVPRKVVVCEALPRSAMGKVRVTMADFERLGNTAD